MQQEELLSSLFQKPPQSGQTPDRDPPPVSPDGHSQHSEQGSKDIESLFRNLVPPPPSGTQPSPSSVSLPVNPPSESALGTATATSNTDRQTALLSLLGTVGAGKPAPPRETPPPPVGPSAQTQGPNQTQQGKFLLEQLVAGNALPQATPPQVSNASQPASIVASSGMPASHSQPPPHNHSQGVASAIPGHLSDREAAVEAQRKSLFEFISPYDALQSNQSPSQLYNSQPPPSNVILTSQSVGPPVAKKKPVPVYNPSPAPASANTSPQLSPKQVHLQRRHTPSPEPIQYNSFQSLQPAPEREPYTETLTPENVMSQSQGVSGGESSEDNRNVGPSQQPVGVQHGPLPPIPTQQRNSPLLTQRVQQQQQQVQQPLPSPPMRPAHPFPTASQHQSPPSNQRQQEYVQQQQTQRGRGSPASIRQGGQAPQNAAVARERAGSPAGSGSGSIQGGNKVPGKATPGSVGSYGSPGQQRNGRPLQYSPTSHALITIDVTSSLTSTLAASDIVSITPIALLKLEPTYTRGTTIGVANFIAYSMSRGRIRLIGRQTGERALLKLPATFPANAQVQDMVISGTKLACVSTDGGLVVWDIPEDIEDDAASVSRIILHVPPHPDSAGFKVVKWHPKQAGMLAIASEKEIYLLNIEEAHQAFGSEGVTQDELSRVSTVFSVPSPLVSFTFDVPQIALASISVDSTITLWSIKDKRPFWSGRVHGEGLPSSIDFLDGGLVVGRNQGNVIQLLPVMSTTVLSTIKFVLGQPGNNNGGNVGKAAVENQDLMFGHLSYDPASKILWIASSARNSLFAVKIGLDSTPIPSAPAASGVSGPTMTTTEPTTPTMRPTFDQIVEFPCSMPTINITVVAAEAAEDGSNWTRDASLAVSAFCVHAGGVDQINISQEAFDDASEKTAAKLPAIVYGVVAMDRADRRASNQSQTSIAQQASQSPSPAQPQQNQQQALQQLTSGSYTSPSQQQIPVSLPTYGSNQRSRTPPPDIIPAAREYDHSAVGPAVVPPMQQQQPGKGKAKETGKASWKASPSGGPVEPVNVNARADTEALTAGLTKEIRKVEENLNTKIGRLIVKELDKQDVRLEEVRRADQTADFERQEKILKLISTELTKNTTRVVESAVKNVIQNSVLPALETVTRNEVKLALNGQIAKGLAESMKQTLPLEIEKLLLRPDVSNNVARTFSSAITPSIERHVKDTITNTLVPAYTQATGTMHQELSREIHSEILNLKKEVVTWQSDALKGTESLIRDMEQSIRSLSEQVKALSVQIAGNSNTPRTKVMEAGLDYGHMRQPSAAPSQSSTASFLPPYSQPNSWVGASLQQSMQAPLGLSSLHPSNIVPPQSQSQSQSQSHKQPTRQEDWDDLFLTTLGYHDQNKLRDLLARTPPEAAMPSSQPSPLSQTVILALIHRLALSLTELSPADDAFNSSLWWLQRSAFALNPNDNIIAPYINRVLQTAAGTLNTTAQRLNVLPGGPSLAEASNLIGQIQQNLSSLMA